MVAGFVDAPQYISTTPSKLDSHSRLMIADLASVSDWNGVLRQISQIYKKKIKDKML